MILLKFYRDSLPLRCDIVRCASDSAAMRTIRHGNPEKHGNAAESGRVESCRGCGMEANCVPAHAPGQSTDVPART